MKELVKNIPEEINKLTLKLHSFDKQLSNTDPGITEIRKVINEIEKKIENKNVNINENMKQINELHQMNCEMKAQLTDIIPKIKKVEESEEKVVIL